MHDPDRALIGAAMKTFFRAVSFKAGDRPAYDELATLFGSGARLIRTSGGAPEISSLDEFVRARQRAIDAGEVTSFEETELAHTTELFGNIARRFSCRRSSSGRRRGLRA